MNVHSQSFHYTELQKSVSHNHLHKDRIAAVVTSAHSEGASQTHACRVVALYRVTRMWEITVLLYISDGFYLILRMCGTIRHLWMVQHYSD